MASKDINDVEKWSEFCDRLIEMTKAGDLKWEDGSDKIGRPDARSPLFIAKHRVWQILLYKYAYKYFYDDDRYDWVEEVAMELIDDLGKNQWTFPKVPNRHHLLDCVQFYYSDVQSLLDDILSEDEHA